MTRIVATCALLALALARPVSAGPAAECCACLIEDHDPTMTALFCVSPTSEAEAIAAQQRCNAIPDASLLCVADAFASAGPTSACVQELRGVGVICPAHPGAPALGHAALSGLTGFLAVAGALALRRRAVRPA